MLQWIVPSPVLSSISLAMARPWWEVGWGGEGRGGEGRGGEGRGGEGRGGKNGKQGERERDQINRLCTLFGMLMDHIFGACAQ